ncbi:hypothetical protein SAMN05421805_105181 [Saccharopolyspora antimicrobica]|uniref:Uncharacterized protein n=1 Tax=Saccharopolyspora antimicrobica TaxID=455193 RepID=A0A1I4ZZQ3_9PSEU|nr:hypothetical protein [Saccharopolyspora antimicrobica]RKT83334.1 hypothetical protein ATL45_1615 [Saccharopolyspora antimicrobica]SFN55603.1 hypothetical protein SAMN05421805_105181 [Saccharopolyspora antimicrobica]
MTEQSGARVVALVFAIASTLLAIPEAAFAAFIGVWAASVPCEPGGPGVCTSMGYTTAIALFVIAAGPVALWLRVRRPGPVLTAVVVGVLGLVVAPLLALGIIQVAATSIG